MYIKYVLCMCVYIYAFLRLYQVILMLFVHQNFFVYIEFLLSSAVGDPSHLSVFHIILPISCKFLLKLPVPYLLSLYTFLVSVVKHPANAIKKERVDFGSQSEDTIHHSQQAMAV